MDENGSLHDNLAQASLTLTNDSYKFENSNNDFDNENDEINESKSSSILDDREIDELKIDHRRTRMRRRASDGFEMDPREELLLLRYCSVLFFFY